MSINTAEFTKFYKDHVKDVYRYAYYKIENKESAEDITSEAFLRMLNGEKWDEVENKKAWIIGITRNIVYETYRDKQKATNIPEGSEPIDSSSVETEAVTEELLQAVKQNLNKIDETSREVIVLRVWEELQFNEIAEIMEMNESAVKLRYYRGVEKLKKLIDEQKEGKKLMGIGFPALLGSILLIGRESIYLPDVGYTAGLTNLLTTQIMDVPKPDPIKPVKPVTETAVDSAGAAAETAATTTKAGTGFNFKLMPDKFEVGSLKALMTQQFGIKLLVYAAAAVAIVGITTIVAADAVTTAIRQQSGLEVNDSANLDGEDEFSTEDWDTFSDPTLGISFMHPQEFTVSEGDFTRYTEVFGTTDAAGIKVGNSEFTMNFIQAKPSESFLVAGFGDSAAVDDFGTVTILSQTNRFNRASSGDGGPGGDGCESSGILKNSYYVEVTSGLYAFFEGEAQDSCIRSDEDSLADRILTELAPFEQTFKAILESIKQVEITKPFNPYQGWKTYSGDEFSIRYPSDWTIAESDPNVGEYDYKNIRLTKGDLEITLGRNQDFPFGFGPVRAVNQKVKVAFGTKVAELNQVFVQSCDSYPENIEDPECSSFDGLSNLDTSVDASVYVLNDTGVKSKLTNDTKTFEVHIWDSYSAGENLNGLIENLQLANRILSTFKQK